MGSMQQKEKSNFLYYTDWAEQLLSFPADLRLKIDDAVKRYVLYGEEPTDRDVLYSMFGLMRTQIDRDRAKYADVCSKNSQNATKRWQTERIRSHTNGCSRIQTDAMDADNDNDNEYSNALKKSIQKTLSDESKESADKPHKAAGKRKAFAPPSLEELCAYVSEQQLTMNPDEFIDYYAANGWRVGKNPMKDWMAAARKWSRRSSEFSIPKNSMQNEKKRIYKDL